MTTSRQKLRASISKKNEAYIRSQPCIVTGRMYVDVAHFPDRRSQGGQSNLLNIVPLTRDWHRLIDDYHEPYRSIVSELARMFHKRLLESGMFTEEELGDKWWE